MSLEELFLLSSKMNIRQFEILREIHEVSKQMVYEQLEEVELDCQYMRNKIVYLNTLIKEYDKQNE